MVAGLVQQPPADLQYAHWHIYLGAYISFVMPIYFELRTSPGRLFEAQGCHETTSPKVQARVQAVANWALGQLPPVTPTKVLGRESTPKTSLDVLHMCAYTMDSREPLLAVSTHVDDLGHRLAGPRKQWRAHELPDHIRDAVRAFDDLAWQSVIEHLGRSLDMQSSQIQAAMPPLAFVSYRREPTGEAVAERLVSFLRKNGIWVWWDADRIGWGDVLGWEETQGIEKADAAIVVYSPDYGNGPGTQREWTQIRHRLGQDPRFKAGALRVGVPRAAMPAELRDRIDCEVTSADDPRFEAQATDLLRGLFRLGPARA